ncbi:MAG: hypothetical protein CM15mP117_00620 [Alphaproteobacteria bacterium]|nr:MAG: hypothetical protein CM15mP117_00620 [Alphaproteobacteria bacterium]
MIFHSFDWALLSQCKHHAPEILTSYLTKTIHDDDIDIQVSNWNSSIEEVQNPSAIPEKIYEAGGSIWCPHFKEITKDSLLGPEENFFAWTEMNPQLNMLTLGFINRQIIHPGEIPHQKG